MGKAICQNCVMSDSDPRISIVSGLCNFCRVPGFISAGNSSLTLDQLRRSSPYSDLKGTKNKCLVGLSGGLDSSYLVRLLVEDLEIRPLVYHVDAGWNSSKSVHNIQRLVDFYDLDLEVDVISWTAFKTLQLKFLSSGILNQDIPQDLVFFSSLYEFAFKKKFSVIFSGANLSTELISRPLDIFYFASDMRFNRAICEDSHVWSLVPNLDTWKQKLMLKLHGIEIYSPLLSLNFEKESAEEGLLKRFGFESFDEKHFESEFTKFFEGYYLLRRINFDVRQIDYSSLIHSGQLTRERALEKLAKPALDVFETNRLLNLVCEQLEISRSSLSRFVGLPVVSERTYPNRRFLFQLMVKCLAMLGSKRSVGRC